MLVTCLLQFVIAISPNGGFMVEEPVTGKLITEDRGMYLVDFSEGLKKYKLQGSRFDYREVLMPVNKCVRR